MSNVRLARCDLRRRLHRATSYNVLVGTYIINKQFYTIKAEHGVKIQQMQVT